MSERHEYHSTDPESQANKSAYYDLLESIQRRHDPKSNTVLIVDDERGIRKFVIRNIQKADPTVVPYEASNGKEALAKLEEIRRRYERDPLFIILDLNMPVMDGWETIKALKHDYESAGEPQGIPIIVLSSTSGEKGLVFKRSVHGGRTGYSPLVSIAKESCVDPSKYDAAGAVGLQAWIKHFTRQHVV
jgi:CheY-like chemotaxis protein